VSVDLTGRVYNFGISNADDHEAALFNYVLPGEPIISTGQSSVPFSNSDVVNGGELVRLNVFNSNTAYSSVRGEGFSIVFIDGYFDSDHPMFGPDLNGDGLSDRVVYAQDFSSPNDFDVNSNTQFGAFSHGTHVAGLGVSSIANYAGVAPGVNIILLKAFEDDGSGNAAAQLAALNWASNPANISAYNIVAVNLSWGTRPTFSGWNNTISSNSEYHAQFSTLVSNNVAIVAASGNGGALGAVPGVASPSSDPLAWSVGSVFDRAMQPQQGSSSPSADQIAGTSQRNASLTDIFAPGVALWSGFNNGQFGGASGTSQAAPFVSGTVALMQDLSVTMSTQRMPVDQMLFWLKSGAKDIFDSPDPGVNLSGDPLETDGAATLNTFALFDRLDVPGAIAGVVAFHGRAATNGNDLRAGWDAPDSFFGLGGSDTLIGNGGNDTLLGGNDTDYLFGAIGNDLLQGELGTDFVYGGAGNDTLYGGTSGQETFAPNDWDTVYGGDGQDLLLTGADSKSYLLGEAGNDTIYGGFDVDWFEGGAGSDTIFMGQLGADLVITRTNDIQAGNTDAIYGFTAGDLFGLPSWAQGAFWVSAFNTGSLGALNVSGGTYYVYFDGLTPTQVTAATGYWA
jgi:Ca2+-binding RTX toxin-like protein